MRLVGISAAPVRKHALSLWYDFMSLQDVNSSQPIQVYCWPWKWSASASFSRCRNFSVAPFLKIHSWRPTLYSASGYAARKIWRLRSSISSSSG